MLNTAEREYRRERTLELYALMVKKVIYVNTKIPEVDRHLRSINRELELVNNFIVGRAADEIKREEEAQIVLNLVHNFKEDRFSWLEKRDMNGKQVLLINLNAGSCLAIGLDQPKREEYRQLIDAMIESEVEMDRITKTGGLDSLLTKGEFEVYRIMGSGIFSRN